MEAAIFNPHDADFVRDPYPVFAKLREFDPVHRSRLGYWVLTRYDDVANALGDSRFSNEPSAFATIGPRNMVRYVAADVANGIIPFLDPPAHTLPRRLISRAFHAHFADSPPDIQLITDQLLEPFRTLGEIDVVHELATPLSAKVAAELLGMPESDIKQLKEWSQLFFYLFAPIPSVEILDKLNQALSDFRTYVSAIYDERILSPRNDLISRLISIREGESRLSKREVVDTSMLIFSDGVENVDSGIGNSLVAILRAPGILTKLQNDVELIATAVEESLRIDPPGQFIARTAKEDIPMGGKLIKKNDAVILVLASANHDPSRFDEPDSFLLTRSKFQHLSFGKGKHSCIGATLVKAEMEVVIKTVIGRLKNPEIIDTDLRWETRMGHRWLEGLSLRFDPY